MQFVAVSLHWMLLSTSGQQRLAHTHCQGQYKGIIVTKQSGHEIKEKDVCGEDIHTCDLEVRRTPAYAKHSGLFEWCKLVLDKQGRLEINVDIG